MSPDQGQLNQSAPQYTDIPDQQVDQNVEQTPGRLAPEYYPASVPQPEPEVVLLEWLADSRVSQQRSREYYSSLLVVVILISLILFFANQVLLIFVVWSFLFITYVLGMVKAETVHNMMTNYGIRYRDTQYYWDEMVRFWIMDNHGTTEIHIETPRMLGGQMILLPSSSASPIAVGPEEIIDLLQRYVPYEQPIPSQIDRWIRWLEDKFPLDSPQGDEPAASAPVPPTTAEPVVPTPPEQVPPVQSPPVPEQPSVTASAPPQEPPPSTPPFAR